MKRVLIILLAGVFFLAGCSIVREDTKQQENIEIPEMVMQQVDLEPRIIVTPALYFLDASKSELAAETRSIAVKQNERAEKKIIEAVIAGPTTENYQPVAEGFAYEGIEILPDVINVYLSTEEERCV